MPNVLALSWRLICVLPCLFIYLFIYLNTEKFIVSAFFICTHFSTTCTHVFQPNKRTFLCISDMSHLLLVLMYEQYKYKESTINMRRKKKETESKRFQVFIWYSNKLMSDWQHQRQQQTAIAAIDSSVVEKRPLTLILWLAIETFIFHSTDEMLALANTTLGLWRKI